ncbi:glucan biosynthesis protein G [Aquabacterium sp. A7-Y]|uniref:glucan biosynthesis protein G n=1 Tax=Aquabacterium sp. A7-Y TaxID=1349605 RepID=UPI00223DCDD1|nr:glucan biosynthesis protein G [Aquabacterium sp. A7-Y]MCW7539822.1 glucan biosynthesis protein G [Aquabacterium sp. A7-Y]
MAGSTAAVAAAGKQRFDFEQLSEQARRLAQQPHRPAGSTLPEELKALDYDQYRDIRFRPERALWRGDKLPFEVMFFHLGKLQTEPVLINEIGADGRTRHIPFSRADFDYGKNRLAPETWGDVGFAGFRVHYPLNRSEYKDELVVFLGASYFRALGAGQHYGLSARGLAIDTVGGEREEFPRFKEFWIQRPAPDASALTVYALLDSPRATGAYQFELKPGAQTVVDVRSRLFLRAGVATLGVAPLTSMFMFGENQPDAGDFRPEVHDSDGLMVATGGGEWIWRPLVRPNRPLATSFAMRELRGFGLMQRDRAFSSYEDTEARYEQRPSTWIEPRGSWGPGRVELVQLPAPDEGHDNVVAYWVPEKLPAPGQPLELAYQMRWQGSEQQRPPGGWVSQTRTGRGFAALAPGERQFIVDFTGPSLAKLGPDAPVKAVVTAGPNGRIVERNAYRNAATGAWRMAVRVQQLQGAQPLELRAYLQHGNDILTETWSNIIPPQ